MLRGPGGSVMTPKREGSTMQCQHWALGGWERGRGFPFKAREIGTDWVEGLALPLPHSPNKRTVLSVSAK